MLILFLHQIKIKVFANVKDVSKEYLKAQEEQNISQSFETQILS